MDKKILLVTPDTSKIPSFGYRCKSAFQSLGWDVDTFNYRSLQFHRVQITRTILNNNLLLKAMSSNPDLIFVDKGESINKGIIEKISSKGIKAVNWCLDDPFGEFSKLNNIENRNEYDAFFTFDPYYVNKLKETGQEKSYYLPCAVDTDLYHEAVEYRKREYDQDLSFIGSHEKKREDFLEGLSDYNLSIFGYRWNQISKKSKIYSKVQPKIMKFDKSLDDLRAYCRTLNSTRINLNIHSNHSREGLNLRAFEIPGTKSFQICDYLKETDNLFKQGKEIVTYHSLDELKELITYYLDNDDERDKISEAGYKRVIKEHTFRHRIKNVLSKIRI